MITPELRQLVRDTSAYAARWSDDADHTVAAGLLTVSGRTVLGINAYHFLGGPCGEVSALSNHASSSPEDPVTAVAAVYGPTGAVISPCGKCRQVLFDVDPAIRCVVRGPAGLEAVPVADLLPYAYDWREMEKPQRIYMWEGYERAIRNGSKRQTIRVDDPFRTGPAVIVFERDSGEVITIEAEVTDVQGLQCQDLTEEHAVEDGFRDLGELNAALDQHYPGLEATAEVDVVSFTIR